MPSFSSFSLTSASTLFSLLVRSGYSILLKYLVLWRLSLKLDLREQVLAQVLVVAGPFEYGK